MTNEPLDQLAVAFTVTEQVIAAVREEQWAMPTPCPEWNVRDLVGHVVLGNDKFTSALGGAAAGAPRDLAGGDSDLLHAYRDSAASLLGAFGQPGILERVVTVPIGPVPGVAALHLRITELLVHGWDLAGATGQTVNFPEGLAEQELVFSLAKLGDIPPERRPFAPPQPVADDAPAIDRLVACLGRKVTAGQGDG